MTESVPAATGAHGMERVHGQIWRDGRAVEGFDLDRLATCPGQSDTIAWADLECPSRETLARVAADLDLDPFAVEDSVAASERVKSVAYARHMFFMVYAVTVCDRTDAPHVGPGSPHARARMFDLHRISIFVKDNVLVTVRLSPSFDMDEVERRWAAGNAMQYGVGALLHGLLDVVADGHFDALQRLDDEIEDLEGLLFDESVSGRELQHRTYDLRRDLVILRRVVLPMREVIGSIQRRRFQNHAPPELDPHFSDLYDHALHATEWIESLRDMITTVFETNLTLADARLNTVMKKLTGWAAIIAVPTLITGFYGENVPFPGAYETSGFITSVVLIVLVVVILYFSFRRRDWL
ncbi:magnesium transporter CorA family protein [Gordonia aurantiaca]|uniref:magnesium transporter CorA family protein n=1 Tax=Gordonia sp. B21 TaxID=3151852 RepID=UPI003266B543